MASSARASQVLVAPPAGVDSGEFQGALTRLGESVRAREQLLDRNAEALGRAGLECRGIGIVGHEARE